MMDWSQRTELYSNQEKGRSDRRLVKGCLVRKWNVNELIKRPEWRRAESI